MLTLHYRTGCTKPTTSVPVWETLTREYNKIPVTTYLGMETKIF